MVNCEVDCQDNLLPHAQLKVHNSQLFQSLEPARGVNGRSALPQLRGHLDVAQVQCRMVNDVQNSPTNRDLSVVGCARAV